MFYSSFSQVIRIVSLFDLGDEFEEVAGEVDSS